MRYLIFAVAAFVLGLGGSTGVVVMTTPVRLTAADSLAIAHADSAAAHPAAPAALPSSGAARPAPSATTPAAPPQVSQPVTQSAPAPAAPAVATASTGGSPAPTPVRVAAPVENGIHEGRSQTAPDGESYKQVGNILLNLKPAEAARIVAYLTDDQVEGLLRSMAPRQAASVLGQLPPERAAALSRRLLVPSREGKP